MRRRNKHIRQVQPITIKQGISTVFLLTASCSLALAQIADTAKILKKVTIKAIKKQNSFTTVMPVQSLNREALQNISTTSVADAARYFSGVLIKDYGGVGGLKTISVRSLGASHTGVIYDGIPVSDVQTGQIDLSRFSSTFVQTLSLHQASIQNSLQPARTYASASALAITTNTFNPADPKQHWQAGIKAGSFGLWQPFAGIYQPLKKNWAVSLNTEAVFSKGDYPFYVNNGNLSEKTSRSNSDVQSFQAEANAIKQFKDSSTLQTKIWGYVSKRGLPGAVIFFNDRSVQQLWNRDVFVQSRYTKTITTATALLVSAKYNHSYTRYTDPDFLRQGGLDNRYKQDELYLSAAINHHIGKDFIVSGAADIASAWLSADTSGSIKPTRFSNWDNIALNYIHAGWQLNASLLYTHISDKTNMGTAASAKDKFTPALAISWKPDSDGPFMLRAFYKTVFRMPTFNDLYYNFIGNTMLKPEYAKQYNAGATWSKHFNTGIKQFSISADAYYNTVKDKIIAVPNKNLFVWTMLNLGTVHIKGLDITTELNGTIFTQLGWFCRIAYTWQQALDVTDPSSTSYKNSIPYTPSNAGSGLASFSYKKWGAGYSMLFSGTRYTLGENNSYNQLDGWGTQDIFISRTLTGKAFNLKIKGELNNISNQHFDVIRYYPMPGRSWAISILFNNL